MDAVELFLQMLNASAERRHGLSDTSLYALLLVADNCQLS